MIQTNKYFDIKTKSLKYLVLGTNLKRYFEDPENPTRNELILFELEHGEGSYSKCLQHHYIMSLKD